MAVVIDQTFTGMPLAQYDASMTEAGMAGATIDKLPGARAHYAWESDGNLRVLDVWDSQDASADYMSKVMMPAAKRLGIEVQPDIKISPLHNSIP